MLPLAALVSSVVLALAGGAGASVDQPGGTPVLTLSVTGRGWGHAIGMSQWGAYGYAQRGATYTEILAHYYPGTELGKAGGTTVRVLLVEGSTSLSIGSDSAFRLTDGLGATRDLEPGRYKLERALKIGEETFTSPLLLTAKGSPLVVNGARYRGTVTVAVEKGKVNAINSVGLEAYLLGVVPREVPRTWPAEALKAQAVAARSYALATRKPSGAFDLYADVRSQVYGGLDGEAAETNAAVQATAGEVLLYAGKVATTYFFSTSGGKTMDIAEAWPGSQPVPYLVSVDDPYDNASPYHTWGPVAVGSQQLRSGLKLSAAPIAARVKLGPSGRVSVFVIALADGTEVSFPAGTVRAALGLRSTWFRIAGRLSLTPPQRLPVTYGARKRLVGFARGVGPVTLERRPFGGSWETMANLALAADGTFAVPFKAERTTVYRLATAKLKGAVARVPVAPRVTLKAHLGVLQGAVRPVLPGAVVLLQRQDGSRWTSVGTALVDELGAFSSPEVELSPGVYRARLAPPPGYAAGLSRTLSVSP